MHSINCCDKVHNIEFQKLYGMGDGLFDKIVKDYPVRVYAIQVSIKIYLHI